MAYLNFSVDNSLVNRYVRSLHEVSVSAGNEKVVLDQLKSIKDWISAIDNHEKFLKKISLITKFGETFISTLEKELKLSKEVSNFLALLLKNKRLSLIIKICDRYLSFLDEIKQKKTFFITYATSFSKSDEKLLTEDLQNFFGGKVQCTSEKDPSLIGGIKVQFRSKVLDYSVKSKLARLRSAIKGDHYEN
jgi:F-type H+-transporting ATPase subunit delta